MISRRSLLQHGATATALAGLTVAAVRCEPREAPAATLGTSAVLVVIDNHRQATTEWLAAIDVLGDLDQQGVDLRRSATAAGATHAEALEVRAAFKRTAEYLAADARWNETSEAEKEALAALVDEPVTSAADMRAKLEYLLALPDPDENLDMVEDVATRLMRSLLSGGVV